MIEAVILELIALSKPALYFGAIPVLIKTVCQYKPTYFYLGNAVGHLEIHFDHKADE